MLYGCVNAGCKPAMLIVQPSSSCKHLPTDDGMLTPTRVHKLPPDLLDASAALCRQRNNLGHRLPASHLRGEACPSGVLAVCTAARRDLSWSKCGHVISRSMSGNRSMKLQWQKAPRFCQATAAQRPPQLVFFLGMQRRCKATTSLYRQFSKTSFHFH